MLAMEAQPAPMSYSAWVLGRVSPQVLMCKLVGKFARPRKTRKRVLQREGTAFANALSLKYIYVIGLAIDECARRVISRRKSKKKWVSSSLRPRSSNFLYVPLGLYDSLGQHHQTFCKE